MDEKLFNLSTAKDVESESNETSFSSQARLELVRSLLFFCVSVWFERGASILCFRRLTSLYERATSASLLLPSSVFLLPSLLPSRSSLLPSAALGKSSYAFLFFFLLCIAVCCGCFPVTRLVC